jgi:hypothetical protein
MKQEKNGKYFVNSRVDIDYSGKKPKIKFGYPQKNPKRQSKFSGAVNPISLLLIVAIPYILSQFFTFYPINISYPNNCTNLFIYNETNITGFNITCNTGNYSFTYKNTRNIIDDGVRWNMKNTIIYSALLIIPIYFVGIIVFFFLAILITIPLSKTNWYKKWFPKINARGKRRFYYKFTKKDVENNIVEIPSFKNIILDYKTKGDFNKYLKKIKIREHRYNSYKKVKGKYKVGKLIKQESYWYARFYFSQKPKDGYLEVIYT